MDAAVSPDLRVNLQTMRRALGAAVNKDIVVRQFTSGPQGEREGFIMAIGGLAEGQQAKALLVSAMTYAKPPFTPPLPASDPILALKAAVIQNTDIRTSQKLSEAVKAILNGECALFLDGSAYVLLADTRYNLGRGVEEPMAESEVRGSRDGFTEDVHINTNLIRRRIHDQRLRFRTLVLGQSTRTEVVMVYLKEVVNPGLVREAYRRLKRIKIDSIKSSNEVEEYIQDNPLSPFASMVNTERPDRTAAAIVEGRVAIFVDNTPFALIIPTTFWDYLKAPGDYYHSFWVSTSFRWLRLFALITAFALPSVYTLLTTFHHEMIPTPLALSIAGGREGTPLPTLVEVLLMEVMFEVIQEAGLRLPQAVGQTVSIVGALVIGEAAVMAGLVAPSTVIVIAVAGITGFAIPNYSASLSVRFLRLPLLLLSGTLGIFGFILGTSFLALHLSSLRVFGTPFLGPLVPWQTPEQQDTLVRLPFWMMNRRPQLASGRRTRRQANNQKPQAPKGGNSS